MAKVSLKQQCYEEIKAKIINCTYAPGAELTEDILCGELNASRTPIREALSRLEQENLVVIRPKKGIVIANFTVQDIHTIYETRNLIEPFCVRTYGYRVNQDRLLEIRKVYNNVNEKYTQRQQDSLYTKDDDLHQLICLASDNPYLLKTMDHIRDQNSRLRVLSGRIIQDRLLQTRQEHLDIIDSILEGRYEQAAQVLVLHLERSKSTALSLLITSRNSHWIKDETRE